MKTILITVIAIFLSNTLYAAELEWVDEQIEAIKPPRKSVNILNIESPFIFLEKNSLKKRDAKRTSSAPVIRSSSENTSKILTSSCDKPADKLEVNGFLLSTVINSSAMINGDWYKKSDKIKSYTITDISKTTVTLEKGDKKLILSTYSKKPTLKFKNK
jgi:hypothetical protein